MCHSGFRSARRGADDARSPLYAGNRRADPESLKQAADGALRSVGCAGGKWAMTILRASAALACVAVGLLAAAWPPSGSPLVNVALTSQGTRVVADSQYGDHVAGANAADGRIGHGTACWFSKDWTQLPCALTFEFGQPERLRRAVLYQGQWSGSMYHTKDFAIETSDDGREWRRVATGALADDNQSRAELDLNAETRWARVVVLTSHIPFQTCGLSEVEFYAERPVAIGPAQLLMNGAQAVVSEDMGDHAFAHVNGGPQALIESASGGIVADLRPGETMELRAPVSLAQAGATIEAAVETIGGQGASVQLRWGDARSEATASPGLGPVRVRVVPNRSGEDEIAVTIRATGDALVRVSDLRVAYGDRSFGAPLTARPTAYGAGPPPVTPPLRAGIEREMIRLDWEAQDGIGAARGPAPVGEALERTLKRGEALARRVQPDTQARRAALAAWKRALTAASPIRAASDQRADSLAPQLRKTYLRVHEAKRALLLADAGPQLGPLVFAKQVPGCFSHQLTQYYGRYARPGGGIYALDRPGVSMSVREVAGSGLPLGSFMHPEVSWDGRSVLFAYCRVEAAPTDTIQGAAGRHYHLFRANAERQEARGERRVAGETPALRGPQQAADLRRLAADLRQLTDGPYDDFSPRFLPDDRMVFISTRRGGWHRCGTPGCENYVLTVAERDGSRPRPLSFHETQEWDPAVLHDGRIVYTRWDYVDRHPVFYEHLWTTGPDGTRAAALFGNNTFNPVGIWEARPVPGSGLLMATAAAHHAMTAGSIILVDPSRGVDGLKPITRLTPDAPFPESETTVPSGWHAPMPGTEPYDTEENRRRPGHCYRSPYPLSERLFLAAYSFRELIGEPHGNPANMFGIYLCDADGNKELLYRDPNIASLWPVPLRPRKRPPALPSSLDRRLADTGVFVLQDVYTSLPRVPRGSVKDLRIVQVLPKGTPGKDLPPIGIPSGAPGKQVLGTVPVEADGSAHFIAPARRELAFHALDARGMAVQVMRSGTYLQPGERTACVGCHEQRVTSPPSARPTALRRPPSRILPGPEGSKPFSYPILVQKVLDRRCVECQ
ncbi:MAG: hypothetical protein FJX72_13370, partial [Armatimonadetes bacterium]|nr:hypothetical protein [Armatimonadota bacterium]